MALPRRRSGGRFPHARITASSAALTALVTSFPAILAPLLLLLALSSAAPAAAQSFGQWWWDGSLGLGQRFNEDLLNDRQLSRFDEQQLRLSLGLNGYVLHPALGNFRVGLDLFLSQLENGTSLDNDNLGATVDLNLLPRGAYPIQLYYRNTRFEFTRTDDGPPLVESRLPDRSSVLGGRVRIRRGRFQGTLVGAERSNLTYLNPEARDQFLNREFVDWGRQLGAINHHVRLEHLERNFSFSRLQVEDFNLLFSQNGDISDLWGWQLSGGGILRELRIEDGNDGETEDYRLRNLLFRPLASGRDRLDLEARLGLRRNDPGASVETYALEATYRWRLKPGWEVAPFGGYALQSGEKFESRAPRAGVTLSWNRSGKKVDTLLSSRLSYGSIQRSNGVELGDETVLGFAVAGSISHGRSERLRKVLEAEVSRNELSVSREPLPDLPDLGLAFDRLSTQDTQRLRLNLDRHWRRSQLGGWIQWDRRESSGLLPEETFLSETFSGTAQIGTGRFNLGATVGETQVEQGLLQPQKIRFDSFTGSWRPMRSLRLRASYRTDTRMLFLTPDIEVERIEAGFSFVVGRIVIDGTVYESQEVLGNGAQRTFQGFQWSVRRDFAGWLPVTTGDRRRGVIR